MPQSEIPFILSLLTFLPLAGALVVMCLPRPKDLPDDHDHGNDDHGHDEHAGQPNALLAKLKAGSDDPARMVVTWTALAFAIGNFILSLVLFGAFNSHFVDSAHRNMQFVENYSWITIGTLHMRYHLGIDGISLLLILLTTFLMVLCVLFSFGTKVRLKEFMVFLLFLETGMIGVFCALDLVLFYVFWEAMLIPMYFLIGIFGHENRLYASIKFFLYTFAGSVFMLIAIVSIYHTTGSFDVVALSYHSSGVGYALRSADPRMLMMMFGAFALAFMIKVPMFPFHTWLPDAHVEAPTAGSVILAGVMLKMGTYGFLRFCLPMFPDQAQTAAPLFIVLAIIGIVYGSIVAAVQPDAKKLVAYSSVAHLGFVILGIFTFTKVGMMGALIQNINHGLATPMLFFIVGMMYDRRHTRAISEYGGLKLVVPFMATMLLIATLASIAVPFFNGFVGEFPVLLGSWLSSTTNQIGGYWPTALAATGMVLSAVYMLWWYQRLMLGPITRPVNRRLPDLTRTEWLVLTPLAAMIFWIGLGSTFWTNRMTTSVDALLPEGVEQLNIEDVQPVTRQLEVNSILQQVKDHSAIVHHNALLEPMGQMGGSSHRTRPRVIASPQAVPTVPATNAPPAPAGPATNPATPAPNPTSPPPAGPASGNSQGVVPKSGVTAPTSNGTQGGDRLHLEAQPAVTVGAGGPAQPSAKSIPAGPQASPAPVGHDNQKPSNSPSSPGTTEKPAAASHKQTRRDVGDNGINARLLGAEVHARYE